MTKQIRTEGRSFRRINVSWESWYRTLLKVLLGPMSENGRRWNRRQTRERRRASASLLDSERSERVPVWSAEVLDRSRRQTYKGLLNYAQRFDPK